MKTNMILISLFFLFSFTFIFISTKHEDQSIFSKIINMAQSCYDAQLDFISSITNQKKYSSDVKKEVLSNPLVIKSLNSLLKYSSCNNVTEETKEKIFNQIKKALGLFDIEDIKDIQLNKKEKNCDLVNDIKSIFNYYKTSNFQDKLIRIEFAKILFFYIGFSFNQQLCNELDSFLNALKK